MVNLDEWVIMQSKRTGIVTTSVSAAEIETRKEDLVAVINSLLELARALPRAFS